MTPPSDQEIFSFLRQKLLLIDTDKVEENRVFFATEMFLYILDHFEVFDQCAPSKLVRVIYQKCNEILSNDELKEYYELIVVCEALNTELSKSLRARYTRLCEVLDRHIRV